MALRLPASYAASISRMSLDMPDRPSTPERLFIMALISEKLIPSFSPMNVMALASTLPQRVPITRPSRGEKPIDVSYDLPLRIAVTEPPLPMWHVMIFELLKSRPASCAPILATYLWLVPWKPYLRTRYFS